MATLPEIARDVLEWIEGWLGGLTITDLIALAVGALALWWVVATMRAWVRLGDVAISTLEQDGDDMPVEELTSLLRERLADGGVSPPPAVPAGSPQKQLLSAIEAVAPQGKFVALLLALLPEPPRPPSYTLTGTLLGLRMRKRPVSIWVRPSGDGAELLDTAEKNSYRDSVCCAADMVQRHVIATSGDAVPHWARWTHVEAFAAYMNGVAASRRGNYEAALGHYWEAADMEPSNLLVRLKMANLVELHAGAGEAP